VQVSDVVDLLQKTIWVMVLISTPVLAVGMVVGIVISVLQTVTSIQESTLTFVPKILAGLLVLMLTGPWMIETMVQHTRQLFDLLIKYAR
jgi:flagellar biosynthetic protein FliQ